MVECNCGKSEGQNAFLWIFWFLTWEVIIARTKLQYCWVRLHMLALYWLQIQKDQLIPLLVLRCRQCYSVITYFFFPNNNTNDQKRKRNKTKVQLSNKIFGCYDKITRTKLIVYLSPADKSSEQWLYTTIITVR